MIHWWLLFLGFLLCDVKLLQFLSKITGSEDHPKIPPVTKNQEAVLKADGQRRCRHELRVNSITEEAEAAGQ